MQENRKRPRTFQEEVARERRFWKQNRLWTLALAALMIVSLLWGSGLSVAPGAQELTLSMHDGTVHTIPYAEITELRLLEKPDFGTMVEGRQTRQGSSGTWAHPQWGEYTLCAYASGECALWLVARGECYVVNLSSPEETRQLYEIIQQKSPVSQ